MTPHRISARHLTPRDLHAVYVWCQVRGIEQVILDHDEAPVVALTIYASDAVSSA